MPTVASEREWDVDDMLIEMLHPEWHRRAACRGMDPAIFYPERPNHALTTRALKVCATCEVRDECDAAGRYHTLGVWGGKTPAMRRREVRERRLEVVG